MAEQLTDSERLAAIEVSLAKSKAILDQTATVGLPAAAVPPAAPPAASASEPAASESVVEPPSCFWRAVGALQSALAAARAI